MTTWLLFREQLASETLQSFVSATQEAYAGRPEPTSFARFLRLPVAQVSDTMRTTEVVRTAAAALLLAPRAAAENYAAYLAAFETPERAAVQLVVQALQRDEIPYADFVSGWDAEKLLDFVQNRVDPGFWPLLAQSLQMRGQKLADAPRRAAFLTSRQSDKERAALTTALATLDAGEPFLSLTSLGQLTPNRVAQLLWDTLSASGQTPHDNALTRYQLQLLVSAAQAVVSENLPVESVVQELLRRLPAELQKGTEALLATLNPQSTTEAVYAVAGSSVEGLLANTVSTLPANHAWVFGLAAWVQASVRQYLAAQPDDAAQPAVDSTQQVQGQLLGQNQQPLSGFGLRITRLDDPEQMLGTMHTGPDGRFSLRFQRPYTFSATEEVEWQSVSFGVEVFRPKQTFADSPAFYASVTVEPAQTDVTVATDLSNELPPLVSKSVAAAVPGLDTLTTLQAYLEDKNFASLADIRRAGGLLTQPDAVFETQAAREAAQRLDALAQFEVVSTDATLVNKLVDQGIVSPRQLVSTMSRADVVQLLTEEVGPEELNARRLEAAALYEQAAGVEALTQALGLYAASERRAGNVVITIPDEPLGEYQPGAPAPLVTYNAENQCDCAACRSAVGPMAYLSALLHYAVTKLKQSTSGSPQPVTAGWLQEQFQQPFCDLPVSCQHAEEPVCQYRLAIEVLRKPLGGALSLDAAQPYVAAVYQALLQALGTSGPEIQQATQSTARAALAKRLRITPAVLEALQTAYDQRDRTTNTLASVEADLERLFGLAGTSRDALSTGVKEESTGSGQLIRWSFQGLEPGVNTNINGELYLEVLPTASPKPLLTVRTQLRSQFAGEPELADTVVATGVLMPDAATTGLYRAMLYPQHDSGLRGSAVIQAAGTLSQVEFTVTVVPAVTTGRLQVLSQEWQAQDADAVAGLRSGATTAGWNGFPFVIDPDVMGPDDIRPLQDQLPYTSQAYRIWRNRHLFLQNWPADQSQPIADIINSVSMPALASGKPEYTPVTGPSTEGSWSWDVNLYPGAVGTQLLNRMTEDLSSADTARIDRATRVLTSVGMSLEAFQRLQAIRQLDPAASDPAYQEALDILRQTLKRVFAQVWAAEEVPATPSTTHPAVRLSGTWFHPAVHEPTEGTWVAHRGDAQQRPGTGPTMPLIDPDSITPLDMPDLGLGNDAHRLWQERKATLQARQQAIMVSGATATTPAARVDAMLRYTYQYTDQFSAAHSLADTLALTPFANLAELYEAYQDTTSEQHAAAATYLADKLKLTPDEGERFMALRAQALTNPTATIWSELASVLVRGWKRALAYTESHQTTQPNGTVVQTTSWVAEEGTDLRNNPFAETDQLLTTRKQRLPKWRASAAARARWTAALAQAFARPLIDPDQLVAGDFRQAGAKKTDSTTAFTNPAYALYDQRLKQVNTWFNEMAATPDKVAKALSTSEADLNELRRLHGANADVSALLRRLGLTLPALDLLDDHLTPGGPDRSVDVRHLLVQVRRERAYADWARQEQAAGIFLSPLLFREPQAETTAPVARPWRSSPRERRTWQQQLTARFEQFRATVAAQEQAVKTAEDQYLPLLRDAMLDTISVTGASSREAKADALGARYLMDFKVGCCQHTTRVAQAIDVLQKVFFNHRHGLPNTITKLVLDSDAAGSFDNEWQWLSSYERWRSLMFLYLYPENVLLPALKPQQTEPFQETIKQIRQTPQLTPDLAADYFQKYDRYLRDYSTLQLVASVQTVVDQKSSYTNGDVYTRQQAVFQLASASSKKVYWNVAYLQSTTLSTEQNLRWEVVPSTMPIKRIVGGSIFQTDTGDRFLCVVAFIQNPKLATASQGDTQLAVQRLNLASFEWDEDFTELEVPGTGAFEEDNAVVVARKDERVPLIITGFRQRADVLLADLSPIFSFPNSASAGITQVHQLVQHPFKQTQVYQLQLSDDGQSATLLSINRAFGFNDLNLWSGIALADNNVLYTMQQKLGADTNEYKLSTVILPAVADTKSYDIIDYALSQVDTPIGAGLTNTYAHYTDLETVKFWISVMATSNPAPINTGFPNFGFAYRFVYSILDLRMIEQGSGLFARKPLNLGSSLAKFIGQQLVTNRAIGDFGNYTNTFEVYYQGSSNGLPITRKTTFTVLSEPTILGAMLVGGLFTIPTTKELAYAHWGSNDSTATPVDPTPQAVTEQYDFVGAPLVTSAVVGEANVLPTLTVQKRLTAGGEDIRATTIYQTPAITTHISVSSLPEINPAVTRTNLTLRTQRLQAIFTAVVAAEGQVLRNLLWEMYYYLPELIALELSRSRYYEEALRYFRLIYDYTQSGCARLVFPGLSTTPSAASLYNGVMTWLADASNPHLLAALRPNSDLRFVVMNVARCLLGYADTEFTSDTTESVSRARSLYELAVGLLKQDILQYDVQDCYAILNQVDPIVAPAWTAEWEAMKRLLASVNQREVVLNVLQDRTTATSVSRGIIWLFSQAQQNNSWELQVGRAWQLINAQLVAYIGRYETLCSSQLVFSAPTEHVLYIPRGTNEAPSLLDRAALEAVQQELASQFNVRFKALAAQVKEQTAQSDYAWLAERGTPIGGGTGNNVLFPPAIQLQLALNATRPYVPFLGAGFCVPTNPVPYSLLLHAELNLYKIRTCRNIAGVQRELDPYAAPTDTTTGMPVIGANGQITRGGRLVVPATQYRYAYIMERARQLVSLAQQAEAALLSALEKRDAESYSLLKARQDIAVSRATIQLQDLRINEAEGGIDLAELQLERSELMEDQYADWLSGGLSSLEREMLDAIREAGKFSVLQNILTGTASGLNAVTTALTADWKTMAFAAGASVAASIAYGLAGAAGAKASAANTRAQLLQYESTFDRRAQEWTFQRNLAAKDIQIGQQQIRLAGDRLRIVGQEKRISELQLDHAEAVLNFLTTKFTNAELYDWMSQILESAYSYFLQQATATARTAEQQLAFERQEVPAGLIQQDYWTPPADAAATTATTDRKGLTGSTRLLADLTRLDQYAFETNRRKLQLTKTVSLAQAFPTEFLRFRETGVLPFALPQPVFDADFPGQYLRIIRRVRTSVIALVPPVEGIKAKLSTAGVSRVVVDGTPFQTLTLPRQPEAVALTSPLNATGLFELEQQPGELLYPFEGMGVDVPWTFSMQKAANGSVDYGTIADVLVTLEYTALESATYAQQVAQALGTEREQMLAFSLRNQFADQWYDLHHAADLAPDDQYVARFTIRATDLPANLRDARLKSLSLYVDAPTDDAFTDRTGLELVLTRGDGTGSGGTAQTNQYGLISTRTGTGTGPLYTGNAAALVPLLGASPVGDWTLSLGPDVRNRLRARLDQGKVEDIYLILEVEGDVPAYTLV